MVLVSGRMRLTPLGGATKPGVAETRRPSKGGAPHPFGPDAPPRVQRKPPKRRPQSLRGPRGPIRERLGGQSFSADENEVNGDAWRATQLVMSTTKFPGWCLIAPLSALAGGEPSVRQDPEADSWRSSQEYTDGEKIQTDLSEIE